MREKTRKGREERRWNLEDEKEEWTRLLPHLFMINLACRFCFISSTLFIASTVEIKSDMALLSQKSIAKHFPLQVHVRNKLSITCLLPQIPVIFYGYVSAFLKLQRVILKERDVCWVRNSETIKQLRESALQMTNSPLSAPFLKPFWMLWSILSFLGYAFSWSS